MDVRAPPDPAKVRDVLCVSAARQGEGEERLGVAFGHKTQGLPIHYALLAVGMLLEERFPRSVYTSGDIDRRDAEVAARMAAPILGRTLPPPVCTDATRLVRRLRAKYAGAELAAAAERLFRGEAVELLEGHVRARSGTRAEAWFCQSLREAAGGEAAKEAPAAVTLLVAWLNAGRGMCDAARLMCHDPRGPQHTPDDFVDTLAESLVAIPLAQRGPGAASTFSDAVSADRAVGMTAWFMSRASPGWHLRTFEPVERVDEALRAAFADKVTALGERFREKSEDARRSIEKLAERSAALGKRFGRNLYEEFESLAVLPSPDAMSEACRSAVECLAWNVRRAQEELRSPKTTAALVRDLPALRRKLVGLKYGHSPTLTEAAWDHFLALEDSAELFWLVGLASLDVSTMPLCDVRRALFENHPLRRWAMDAGLDAARMERVGEEIRRTQAADKRAGR